MLLTQMLERVSKLALPAPLAKADDLVIEEYKACRELNLTNIKIIEKNETYVVSAISAVFLFGLATKNGPVFKMQGVIAFAVAILGAMRSFALDHVIDATDRYFRQIERRLPVDGWSTFYKKNGSGPLGWTRKAVWIVVIILTFLWMVFCLSHSPVGDKCH